MIEWRDTGILLSTRKHGETSAIIEVFTPTYGKHAGVVRGGTSRKIAPHLQPGAQLHLAWRARLEDHLGAFTVEPQRSRAAAALTDRLSLAGLNAVVALLSFCLTERDPHPALYQRSEQLLDLLGQHAIWPLAYLRWEQTLLEDLGFGLDLDHCAATGTSEDLVYVSPKSGRAVSRHAAGIWADRLLPLPSVLRGQSPDKDEDILQALRTTGHFLEHHLAPQFHSRPLPQARAHWVERLTRSLR